MAIPNLPKLPLIKIPSLGIGLFPVPALPKIPKLPKLPNIRIP